MNIHYNELDDAHLALIAGSVTLVFDVLVERHEASIRRFISRFLNHDADAIDDVLQETFIRMYRFINTYNPAMSFRGWLYRIARNEVNRYLKKEKINQPLNESSFLCEEGVVGTMDMFADLNREIQTDPIDMARLLNDLDEKYRTVLILRYYEGLSYEEIGDVLKIPGGSVATMLHRAKKQFMQNAIQKGFLKKE